MGTLAAKKRGSCPAITVVERPSAPAPFCLGHPGYPRDPNRVITTFTGRCDVNDLGNVALPVVFTVSKKTPTSAEHLHISWQFGGRPIIKG
jgi:hypothetical protein